MPLDLEDERARGLLTGLLREAARGRTSPLDDFRVERFLRRTGAGWRLGARIQLPASVPADYLARQLRVSAVALPPRLEVRVHGERVRVVGLYAAQSEGFLLARNVRPSAEFWDAEAAGEIRLMFLAGDVVGEPVVPYRGSALSELPWAFRGDDDGSFIGEGSVNNRSPEIVVLVRDGYTPYCLGEPAESSWKQSEESAGKPAARVHDLNRTLWRISEPAAIETSSGRCVIRPSSGKRQKRSIDYPVNASMTSSLPGRCSAAHQHCASPRPSRRPVRCRHMRPAGGKPEASGNRVPPASDCGSCGTYAAANFGILAAQEFSRTNWPLDRARPRHESSSSSTVSPEIRRPGSNKIKTLGGDSGHRCLKCSGKLWSETARIIPLPSGIAAITSLKYVVSMTETPHVRPRQECRPLSISSDRAKSPRRQACQAIRHRNAGPARQAHRQRPPSTNSCAPRLGLPSASWCSQNTRAMPTIAPTPTSSRSARR